MTRRGGNCILHEKGAWKDGFGSNNCTIKDHFTFTESWFETADITVQLCLVTLITAGLSHDPSGHMTQVEGGWLGSRSLCPPTCIR